MLILQTSNHNDKKSKLLLQFLKVKIDRFFVHFMKGMCICIRSCKKKKSLIFRKKSRNSKAPESQKSRRGVGTCEANGRNWGQLLHLPKYNITKDLSSSRFGDRAGPMVRPREACFPANLQGSKEPGSNDSFRARRRSTRTSSSAPSNRQ